MSIPPCRPPALRLMGSLVGGNDRSSAAACGGDGDDGYGGEYGVNCDYCIVKKIL